MILSTFTAGNLKDSVGRLTPTTGFPWEWCITVYVRYISHSLCYIPLSPSSSKWDIFLEYIVSLECITFLIILYILLFLDSTQTQGLLEASFLPVFALWSIFLREKRIERVTPLWYDLSSGSWAVHIGRPNRYPARPPSTCVRLQVSKCGIMNVFNCHELNIISLAYVILWLS